MDQKVEAALKKLFGNDKACYVVLTCGEPSDTGAMDVEMCFEGDPFLAAYLLDSARTYIEEELEEDEPGIAPASPKTIRLAQTP